MADLAFMVVVVAFFLLCVGYVRVCDRIIGPDSPVGDSQDIERVDDPEAVVR